MALFNNRIKALLLSFVLLVVSTQAQASWYFEGEKFFDAGNYEGAIAQFSIGIERYPGNAALYIIRGRALAALRKFREAIPDYDKAISLKPKTLFYNSKRKHSVVAPGNLGKLADYHRAFRIYPLSLALYSRGNAYSELGRHQQAVADYSAALQLYPKNADALLARGRVYMATNRRTLALRDWISAANMGHRDAQKYLEDIGLRW